MATPTSSNLSQTVRDTALKQMGEMLSEQEKALPKEERNNLLRQRVTQYLKNRKVPAPTPAQNNGAPMNQGDNGVGASGNGMMQNMVPQGNFQQPQIVPPNFQQPSMPNPNMQQQVQQVQQMQQGGGGQMMNAPTPRANSQPSPSPRMMQGQPGNQQMNMNIPQQMNGQQQMAFQQPMQASPQQQQMNANRMQQQQQQQFQQQHNLAQAHLQQQQQQQNMHPPNHPTPNPNMPSQSPQQLQRHPSASSPMTGNQNMMGPSPSNMNYANTPPQNQQQQQSNNFVSQQNNAGMKSLIEVFPRLVELKAQGRLEPEQEKLFDMLMSTEAGREQMNQVKAQHAATLIQRHLTNPVGQGMPQLSQQQLQMAMRQGFRPQQGQPNQQQQHIPQQQQANLQQMAAQRLQQNQMNPQMQQQNQGFPPNVVPNGQQPQLTQQQLQQLHIQRQIAQAAQAQQMMGRSPQQQQGGQPQQQQQQQPQQQQAPNAAQIAALARAQAAAQGQLQHAAQHMGLQGQQQQMMEQAANANFGSPRPPQQGNMQNAAVMQGQMQMQNQQGMMQPQQQQQMQQVQQQQQQQQRMKVSSEKIQQYRLTTIAKLSQLDDQQREQWFQQRPGDRQIWFNALHNPQQMAQNIVNNNAGSPQVGGDKISTPNMPQGQIRPPGSGGNNQAPYFPVPNNVSANLHIPPGKQRKLSGTGSQLGQGAGTPGGPQSQASPLQRTAAESSQQSTGSPQSNGNIPNNMLLQQGGQMQAPVQMTQNQAQAIQAMIRQGIPVNVPPGPMAGGANQPMQGGRIQIPPGMLPGQGTPGGQNPMASGSGSGAASNQPGPQGGTGVLGSGDVRPHMFMNQLKAQAATTAEDARETMRQLNEQFAQIERSESLLRRTTWEPTEEYDNSLQDRLRALQMTLKPYGRSTLAQGLGGGRVLSDVLVERMPEALRAMAEEVGAGVGDDEDKTEQGLPGQKKRKIAELASVIDRALEIDQDVETFFLNLADEHIDLISNLSCNLAKHRKSDTVDRKDVQLAYEMTGNRSMPGFSSDTIRADQARSTKRAQNGPGLARVNKLKAIEAAKASYRKEKAVANAPEESNAESSNRANGSLVNGTAASEKVNGDLSNSNVRMTNGNGSVAEIDGPTFSTSMGNTASSMLLQDSMKGYTAGSSADIPSIDGSRMLSDGIGVHEANENGGRSMMEEHRPMAVAV